ncbi:Rap1a/Tai family immunity protein [Paracoccus marinaquae]|uniref:Rap1a immunity protein domain-containing protein n=1 Tax=Paracoccus marinaquae TaxID=2841926 RepID=A0ABS6AE52_9RHOB|nr:Rap1a/Tai family immunity protein [Paracoccus marinaquae]MBU3028759.1 hypothetical protein [Paracoccus marinaquae]
MGTVGKMVIATIVAVTFSSPLRALEASMQLTGAGFSEACTRLNESWISFCNGYVQAIVDTLAVDDDICFSSDTTRTDIVTAVEQQITSSTQLQARNAAEAVRTAMASSFPCR